jgi:hypothetical protein
MSQGYERNFPELCIPSDFALFSLYLFGLHEQDLIMSEAVDQ